MNSPMLPHPTPRRDIQGLRALAVLAVIGAHAVGWPRGGFVGVDVFFVVSGFLITGALLREVQLTGGIRLAAFAGRRARRILPLAVVVLLATAASAFVVFNRPRAEQTLVDALWSAGFAANWRFTAVGTDYCLVIITIGRVSKSEHFDVVSSDPFLGQVIWHQSRRFAPTYPPLSIQCSGGSPEPRGLTGRSETLYRLLWG